MRSVNKVILVGNVTRDPEVKKTATGQTVATFGLATNREWVTANREKHTLAEFHNLVAWGKLAEICSQYLKKGKLVYTEGYLKTRSWDSPEGVKIFKTEIVIYDMIMLEKRPKEDETPGSPDFIPQGDDGFATSEPPPNL
jgi:single-strand DNA-binding protein